VKFLPANANASGLVVVDNVAYAVTSGNCGGAADGLWALDIATKSVSSWKGAIAGANNPAFGPDGTVYVASASGDLLALEPKTLSRKAAYSAGQALVSSPVVMERKGKTYVAVAAKDGSIHVVDATSMSKFGVSSAAGATSLAVAADGILASSGKGVSLWSLNDQGSLQQAWASKEVASPLTPGTVNGVVFALSPGSASTHATLLAMDAATGKELWSSGSTITSYVAANGGIAIGGSAVYFGTHDGTFWAFGFPIEH
jgi:outer membrane protein assembly factor BamB